MNTESLRNGDDGRMSHHVWIRRQQRKTLIHNPTRLADFANATIPSTICKASVLHGHGFNFCALEQGRKLQGVDVAHADRAGTTGSLDLLDRIPDFPVLFSKAGI